MKVCCIMATCGRHTLAERSLRFFLDQVQDKINDDYYPIYTLLIYNNSNVELSVDAGIWNGYEKFSEVILINNHIDSVTKEPYKNLGAIYNDALKHTNDPDIIVHWDDDDIFLPSHLSEGVKGYLRAKEQGKLAYKPERSYYRHPGGVQLMGNNLEPSVFVDAKWLYEKKYSLTTSDQHMSWFNPLLSEDKMFVDPNGKPTLIYNWGDTIPTFKTSGNPGNVENFSNYRRFSKDHGDKVLTPWSKEAVEQYYKLV